jgi:hypothetical protein
MYLRLISAHPQMSKFGVRMLAFCRLTPSRCGLSGWRLRMHICRSCTEYFVHTVAYIGGLDVPGARPIPPCPSRQYTGFQTPTAHSKSIFNIARCIQSLGLVGSFLKPCAASASRTENPFPKYANRLPLALSYVYSQSSPRNLSSMCIKWPLLPGCSPMTGPSCSPCLYQLRQDPAHAVRGMNVVMCSKNSSTAACEGAMALMPSVWHL